MISKLRNLTGRHLRNLENKRIYNSLRKIRILVAVRKKIKETFPNKMVLHGDKIFQEVFKTILRDAESTSFIETGTYYGWTIEHLARIFPHMPMYSCEINYKYYKKAKNNLSKLSNIRLIKETSPIFLEKILKNPRIGKNPSFYLDAHWGNEWPLKKEILLISKNLKQAVYVIDDFKVPGSSQFSFDKYHEEECSIEMISPFLSKKNRYTIIFPNYTEKEAFSNNVSHSPLTGYVIIMQNMKKSTLDKLKSNILIKKYFKINNLRN